MNKMKFLLLSTTGMVALGLAIGGGTYAFFNDTATSQNNSFSTGTLKIDTHRDDVPVTGPMFYTDNSNAGLSSGIRGTGLWAPLDSHTRSLVLINSGSLDAKLKHLGVKAEAGTSQADLDKFAEQAVITIATVRNQRTGELVDGSLIDGFNKTLETTIKREIANGHYQSVRDFAAIKDVLTNEFASIYPAFAIEDVYSASLKDFLANGHDIDPVHPIIIPGTDQFGSQARILAYTISVLNDNGQTFKNNDIQGKTINLAFNNEFVQAKNNN